MNDNNDDEDDNFLVQEEKPSVTKSFLFKKKLVLFQIKNLFAFSIETRWSRSSWRYWWSRWWWRWSTWCTRQENDGFKKTITTWKRNSWTTCGCGKDFYQSKITYLFIFFIRNQLPKMMLNVDVNEKKFKKMLINFVKPFNHWQKGLHFQSNYIAKIDLFV